MEAGKPFTAWWVGSHEGPREDFGVTEFGLDFELQAVPKKLNVRVSGDQRFTLFVNGNLVLRGPQRGDVRHWHYHEIDIATFLKSGSNQITSVLTNSGWLAPMAQLSARNAFLLEAEEAFGFLSTPNQWRFRWILGNLFKMMNEGVGEYYIDVGPGEIFHCPSKWSDWYPVHPICRPELRGEPGGGSAWALIPASISMIPSDELILPIRAFQDTRLDNFESFESQVTALKDKDLILDFGELIVGYPTFEFNATALTEVRVIYAESPVDENGIKGDRNELFSKEIRGYADLVCIIEPGVFQFRPNWLRTFRYIRFVTTRDVELCFCGVEPAETLFSCEASFDCDEATVQPIWDMCVRTLKLCAGDTYYDCPYYEQLQYIGDTRLQALIGYYLSRDRTLQRNAIEQFHWSILENGLTQSRYPSRQMQVIPPFSLWWIVMICDAWMHDPGFDPKPYLHGARGVLEAYQRVCDGELEPFWCFGDWVPEWKWGVPPGGPNAEMHLVLFEIAKWCFGQLQGSVEGIGQISPISPIRPISTTNPTEHAEALWRYFQTLSGLEPDPWDEAILEIAPRCTYFWQCVKHVGMQPEDYVSLLSPWREMLSLGLTTTPETPEPTRSDCHGWSAHPPLGLLQLVAGVTSIAPGWSKVRIAPRPGSLSYFKAVIPHPSGDIEVELENGNLKIVCPVYFELLWKRETREFEAGSYQI